MNIQAEASLGADAPFIAKLFVKLLAQIKGSDKQRMPIRQRLQRNAARLKADTNLLLQDAYEKIRQHSRKGFGCNRLSAMPEL